MKITLSSGNPVLSQGTPEMTPQDNMNNIIQATQNFVGFTYNFDTANDVDFSTIMGLTSFVASQNNRYVLCAWQNDANLVAVPQSTNTFMYYLASNGYGAIAPTGQITLNAPVAGYYSDIDFVCGQLGTGASINYANANATLSFANKTYPGIIPLVTTNQQYTAGLLNGVNLYAQFASRANVFTWSENGTLGGIYLWIDNLYNQAWLIDAVQVAEAGILNSLPKLSFANLSPLKAVILGVMTDGINNGVIQAGNVFSAQQTAILKQQAGVDITPNLTNAGYYVQILQPTAVQRQQRALAGVNVWYSNGGAVNTIKTIVTLVI